tara:strand:- start:461 stop:706 length:246 start_codon:yes stop_codon:yes gene_type:complete
LTNHLNRLYIYITQAQEKVNVRNTDGHNLHAYNRLGISSSWPVCCRISYQEVSLMSCEWFYIQQWQKNREEQEKKKNKKTS